MGQWPVGASSGRLTEITWPAVELTGGIFCPRDRNDRSGSVPATSRWSANDVVDGSPTTCGNHRGLSSKESHDGDDHNDRVDIAKSVFQVHGIDAAGKVVVRRRLSRARVLPFFEKLPRCLVGIEACNTSHHWARELIALGHDVRLMPAQYAKPYVKRGKNDAADAEAICEAVTRPTMRYVAVMSPEQQSLMMLHRVRLMLSTQRTQLSNAMRAHMSEFGVVAPVGRLGVER